jgi:hypothetical protein
MTPKQTLLAHLREHHRHSSGDTAPSAVRNRNRRSSRPTIWRSYDTFAELQQIHSRIHHRYGSSLDHFHENDGAGALVGPGTDERRPSGWKTGEGVVPRVSHVTHREA